MSRLNKGAALPELREASSSDIPALLEVFFHAMEDLDTRKHRPVQPRNPAPLQMHFEHLLATDPQSSIVADDQGHVIAFGIVMHRGADAFLSFLFVEPRWQGRGLGRAVFDTCVAGVRGAARLSTCAEADQPVSTGLYASMGMAPRTPIYLVRGSLRDGELPDLPVEVRAQRVEHQAVDALDRDLLGYSRPHDHQFWVAGERQGWMYLAGDDVVGYGYAHRSGRIGPVAAVEPGLLPGLVGHLARNTPVLEGRQLVLPGPCIAALEPLLARGLRIDGTPAVFCSQGPGPRFDRYIPMSFALL